MPDRPVQRIVVGVDGSEQADSALSWAIRLATPFQAEVVAVFAIPLPTYTEYGGGYAPAVVPPELDPEWRAGVKREFEEEWTARLKASGLRYRTVLEDGRASTVISELAEREDADLIVVGRRGRSGLAELVLGSVSHELSHHASRPVLITSAG